MLLLSNGKSAVHLDKFISTKYECKMNVKNIAIYWKFKNVLKSANDTVIIGSNTQTFEEGYWTFNMISEKLEQSNVQIERNKHDNTCKIYSVKNLN